MGVRMQSNDKLEVSLFWIGSSLLPHIVVSCLGKVQPSNSDFAHLAVMQINTKFVCYQLLFSSIGKSELTALDETVSWTDLIDFARCGLFDWGPLT